MKTVSLFKIFTCFQFFNTHLLKQFTTDFRVICGDIVYAQKDEGAHMLLLVYRPSVYAHLMVASLCVPSRVAIEFPEIGVNTIDSQSGEGIRVTIVFRAQILHCESRTFLCEKQTLLKDE